MLGRYQRAGSRLSRAARWAALAACVGLAAASTAGQAQAQTRVVKMATIAVANSPWHQALKTFKEVVDRDSKGRYSVGIYTDGSLGDINALLSSMQIGTVELSYFGLSTISFIRGGEVMNVIYVPYLFKSGDWAEKILNNDDFQKVYGDIAAKVGVRVLCACGQRSPRAIQTTKGPILKPEDMKGLRMRIPAITVLKAAFERVGVQVTPLGMLEIYNALSRGTVDGQDNGFDLSVPPRYHEVAKYWSATDHVQEMVGMFVSERFWRTLPPEDKAVFQRAGIEAGKVATEITRKFDKDSVDTLKSAGVTYVEPDRAAFAKVWAGIEDEFEGKLWPAGLVDRIRKAQEQ